jgi:hypothetical protein
MVERVEEGPKMKSRKRMVVDLDVLQPELVTK